MELERWLECEQLRYLSIGQDAAQPGEVRRAAWSLVERLGQLLRECWEHRPPSD